MPLRFGTDGVRGVANDDLTPEFVTALGRAAARVLRGETFLVGRDTRRSGAMLAGALAAGFAAEGCDVVDLGVITTPGVAWLATEAGHPAAVISASHNPFPDNGIKLLGATGSKLADETEHAIERELDAILEASSAASSPMTGERIGRIELDPTGAARYRDHLVATAAAEASPRLKVVVDCANGAAFETAPAALSAIGHDVTVLFADPDGTNINAGCGSTDPAALQQKVVELGADVGLSFDGDADRLIAVDDSGAIVDGDILLALFADDLSARGALSGGGVVITVMANLGLRRELESRGHTVVETALGDRNVTRALEQRHFVLGGEPSGHIVFFNERTTGDGILTGIRLLSLIQRSGKAFSELSAHAFERVPQELRNVVVADPARVAAAGTLREAIERVEVDLAGSGRVLVRASGTERAVRVMVEADDPVVARKSAERLVEVVEQVAATSS